MPKTATADEIRSAFRKLARKYHPDVAKDKKAAEEKFKEINEAYSSAPIGIGPAVSSRHRNGKASSSPAADFINGAAMAVAELNSSSAELGSAISSKRFLAAGAVVPHSAGSADALRRPNAAPM